jgi:hypothetical protein
MSLLIILVAWWVCNSLIQSRGVMFVNDKLIRCHSYFDVWGTTVTSRSTRAWGISHKTSLPRPLFFKDVPEIVLCARARLSNCQAVFRTLLLGNLISNEHGRFLCLVSRLPTVSGKQTSGHCLYSCFIPTTFQLPINDNCWSNMPVLIMWLKENVAHACQSCSGIVYRVYIHYTLIFFIVARERLVGVGLHYQGFIVTLT